MKMLEEHWSSDQNEAIKNFFSKNDWKSKKECCESLAERGEFEGIDWKQVQRHAKKHLNLEYKGKDGRKSKKFSDEAVSYMVKMIDQNYNNSLIVQSCKRKFGIDVDRSYLGQLRYKLRNNILGFILTPKGEYHLHPRKIWKDSTGKDPKNMAIVKKNIKISEADFEDLIDGDASDRYKHGITNMVGHMLQIKGGKLQDKVGPYFETYHVFEGLRKFFKESGIADVVNQNL